jgi:hypothetical protein
MAHDEDFHLRIKHDYWILLIEFCARPVPYGDGVRFRRSSLVSKNEFASIVVTLLIFVRPVACSNLERWICCSEFFLFFA